MFRFALRGGSAAALAAGGGALLLLLAAPPCGAVRVVSEVQSDACRACFGEEGDAPKLGGWLHHLNPEAQRASQADNKRLPTAFHAEDEEAPHVVRIALTGGPCAGKSSALENIRKWGTEHGFDVYLAPEVATILMNTGLRIPAGDEEGIFTFQRGIISMQLELERHMTAISQQTKRAVMLIYDRGTMDSKGYMGEAMWERLLQKLPPGKSRKGIDAHVTEDYLLSRYDGVIHLVTAADGAEAFYKHGQTVDDTGKAVFRRETAEEARELDKKMQWAWKDHPHRIIVDNSGGSFDAKLEKVSQAVLEIATSVHAAPEEEESDTE